MVGFIAFLNIGFPEMVIIFVLGLLIYGRRLPEVGAQVGRHVANLKRSLNDFKAQIDTDDDIRSVRDSFQDVRSEIRAIPKITASGASQTTTYPEPTVETDLWDLTDEGLSSPPPATLPGTDAPQ